MQSIVAVYAKYEDRDILLGYVNCPVLREDLESYFKGREAYGIQTVDVLPITIPAGYAKTRRDLEALKKSLESQLRHIDAQIENS